jgi:Tfp pilus assembly protein PilF
MNNEARFTKLMEMLEANPSDVFLNFAVAMEYLGRGNEAKTIEWLIKTLQYDETLVAAYYQLGLLFMNAEQPDEATRYLNKGMKYARSQNDQKSVREIQALLDELMDW